LEPTFLMNFVFYVPLMHLEKIGETKILRKPTETITGSLELTSASPS